jgi:4-aminobutyrate aminotransferase-like enzyme
MDNAETVGRHFRAGLEELKEKHPLIGDVRGMGLMQALELVRDRKTKEIAPQETTQFLDETRKRGLLVGKGGMLGNVIRIAPMLNTTKADVDEALRIMDESLAAVGASAAVAAK